MDADTRTRMIEQYEHGYAAVEDALAGVTDAELDARPAPEEWTAREIVHHLADSEMTSAIRLRKLLAEESPTIVGYDQVEFARRLQYDRPLDGSLLAFRGAREKHGAVASRVDR